MNGSLYACMCNPQKIYKRRKDFEQHMRDVHRKELQELAILREEQKCEEDNRE